MKLIVHELGPAGLSQKLIPDRNMFLAAIRPHILRYGRPTGSLKVELRDTTNDLIAESNVVNISDIGSADYFHGYIRFDISAGLQKDTEYVFKVVGGDGYSFSESAYIGVCNDYDLRKYPTSYPVAEGVYAPLDMEVWTLSPR